MASSQLLLSALLNSLTIHIATEKNQNDIVAELARILPVQLKVIDASETTELLDCSYDTKQYALSRSLTRTPDPIESSYDTKSFLESMNSAMPILEPQTAVSILEAALQSKAALDKITKRKINQTLRKEKKKEKQFLHKKNSESNNVLLEETDLMSPAQVDSHACDTCDEFTRPFAENVLVIFNMRLATKRITDDIDSLRHGTIKTRGGIKSIKLPKPFSIILVSRPNIPVRANIAFYEPNLKMATPFTLAELRDSDFDNKVYCGLDLEAYLALIYHQIMMKSPTTPLSIQQSVACAKVVAGLQGRDFVLPVDVEDIVKHILIASGYKCDDYESLFNKIRPV